MRWEGAEYREDDFVDGMRRYVSEDHPIYAMDDGHGSALHEFLFAASPDPRGLLALFAANRKREVDDAVLKRDLVASIVATSFERRIVERPSDPHRAALYDALALAFANFAFDPSYEDAHTRTSLEVGDFFADGRFPPCAESRAAFERHLPGMLEAWRGRVTRRSGRTCSCGSRTRRISSSEPVSASSRRSWTPPWRSGRPPWPRSGSRGRRSPCSIPRPRTRGWRPPRGPSGTGHARQDRDTIPVWRAA
jgi:hypothetical protein